MRPPRRDFLTRGHEQARFHSAPSSAISSDYNGKRGRVPAGRPPECAHRSVTSHAIHNFRERLSGALTQPSRTHLLTDLSRCRGESRTTLPNEVFYSLGAWGDHGTTRSSRSHSAGRPPDRPARADTPPVHDCPSSPSRFPAGVLGAMSICSRALHFRAHRRSSPQARAGVPELGAGAAAESVLVRDPNRRPRPAPFRRVEPQGIGQPQTRTLPIPRPTPARFDAYDVTVFPFMRR